MPITLLANQCPAPQLRTAFLSVSAARSAANAPVSTRYVVGAQSGFVGSLNADNTRQDLASSFGGGAYFVANGLALSAGTGLQVAVSIGTAIIDGVVTLETAQSLAVPASASRVWIWLQQTGLLAYTTSTAPPASPSCLLGSVVTGTASVTATDTSGVLRGQGILQRQTADAAAPTDTPPASLHFVTKTAGGVYYWDGGTYWSISGGGSSGGGGASYNYRGAYSGSATYNMGDLAASGGALYLSVATSTGIAVTNTSYWTLFLPAGTPGATGPAGPAGPTGAAGPAYYNFRGPWSSGVTYAIADAVYDATGAYVAILGSTGVALSDAAHWKQILPPGPTGAQGPSILVPRGPYSSTASYAVNDVVTSSGAAYWAILASTGQLVTNTTYWSLLVPAAPAGATGPTGPTGPAGPAGSSSASAATGSALGTVKTDITESGGSVVYTKTTSDSTFATTSALSGEATSRGNADVAEMTARVAGDALAAKKASNLSDLASASAARSNLGVGSALIIYIPGTLVTGADALEIPVPSWFSSRALTRLTARLGTASSSGSVTFTVQLATSTGVFTAAQTSDTITLPVSTNQPADVTSFTAGITASGGNALRLNITAAGTGAKDLTVKLEF